MQHQKIDAALKREGYKTLNARGAFERDYILKINVDIENATNCHATICRSA